MVLGNLINQRQIQDLKFIPGNNHQFVREDITNILYCVRGTHTKKIRNSLSNCNTLNPILNSSCSLCYNIRVLLAGISIIFLWLNLSQLNFIQELPDITDVTEQNYFSWVKSRKKMLLFILYRAKQETEQY